MKINKKKSIELILDLHGITYNKIDDLLEDYCFINTPPFKIITGNSNQMKEIVYSILEKHNLRFYTKSDYNLGCLVINDM